MRRFFPVVTLSYHDQLEGVWLGARVEKAEQLVWGIASKKYFSCGFVWIFEKETEARNYFERRKFMDGTDNIYWLMKTSAFLARGAAINAISGKSEIIEYKKFSEQEKIEHRRIEILESNISDEHDFEYLGKILIDFFDKNTQYDRSDIDDVIASHNVDRLGISNSTMGRILSGIIFARAIDKELGFAIRSRLKTGYSDSDPIQLKRN